MKEPVKENPHKKDFPMFTTHAGLVYLDSAATSLTPQSVLDKMNEYYSAYGTNVSRSVYALCEQATTEYESIRRKVAEFINAQDSDEIIFTTGTTHALNLIAKSFTGRLNFHVVVTAMDHHANFVPWQSLCHSKLDSEPSKDSCVRSHFQVIDVIPEGLLDLNDLREKVTIDTTVLAFPYISNVLGTINPVKEIIQIAKEINPDIITVVDAAQAAPHVKIDVVDLDCDFLVFSAHKIYGPTGAGVLWGKKEKLEHLSPLFTGGDMIAEVTSRKSTYRDLPHRLEAGTPNIAGILGMGAAIDYMQSVDLKKIASDEKELAQYTHKKLSEIEGLTIHGPDLTNPRISVISFSLQGIHPHDIASILDTEKNIAVRAGNHCAMPLHTEYLGIPASTRVSLGLYNTKDDIDKLVEGLHIVKNVFSTSSSNA